MALLYYDLLDSVAFRDGPDTDTGAEARINACARVIREQLIDDAALVLSQNQLFDSNLVMEILCSSQSAAFLELIRASRIRTRFLPMTLPDRRTPSLENAFLGTLVDKPHFQWSAWPELNQPDSRVDLIAYAEGRAPRPPKEFLDRIEVLRMLDLSFDQSQDDERPRPVTGPQLSTRIIAHANEPDPRPIIKAFQRRLGTDQVSATRFAGLCATEIAGHTGQRPRALRLDLRSDWYALIDSFLRQEGLAAEHSAGRYLRSRVVDVEYNCVIAESLGASSAVVRVDEHLSSDESVDGEQAIALRLVGNALKAGEWLDWTKAAALLLHDDAFCARDRERRLEYLQEAELARRDADGSLATIVRLAPRRVAAAAGFIAVEPLGGFLAQDLGRHAALAQDHTGLIGVVISIILAATVPAPQVLEARVASWLDRPTSIISNRNRERVVATVREQI